MNVFPFAPFVDQIKVVIEKQNSHWMYTVGKRIENINGKIKRLNAVTSLLNKRRYGLMAEWTMAVDC